MTEARATAVTETPWVGEFLAPRTLTMSYEPHAELVGPGSLTPTDDGLRVTARWHPRSRRMAFVLLGVVLACLAAAMLLVAAPGAGGAAMGAVALGAFVPTVALSRWHYADRPIDVVMPWSEVARPGVSEDALVFEVRKPTTGTVRFTMPGKGLRELRAYAKALQERRAPRA